MLTLVLVMAVVVAIDPHPFDGPTDAPSIAAAAAEPLITGSTATTMPSTVTVAPTRAASDPGHPTATTPLPATTVAPATSPPAVSASTQPPATQPAAGTSSGVMTTSEVPSPSVVAHFVTRVVLVYQHEGDAHAAFGLYSVTELGTPRVLLTTAVQGDWIQVLLPLRPNGSTGWVHTRDVTLETIHDRVDVDLALRMMTWSRDGVVLLQVAAAVGSTSTPTPAGTFFVTDVLPWNPSDGRGAWVVALNGHSDAYATFDGGDARIAIHGTNDPSSIGRAVSNGCVRLDAGPLDQLRSGVPLGTPVVIQ
jgi:lipoprotein-anchoring transpeptidase ErfK/SrfK